MQDYTRYTLTIKTDHWTRVTIREEWLDPHHIFGIQQVLLKEVKQWLDNHEGGSYAVIEDEETFVAGLIVFNREIDATAFLLRWS